MSTDVIVQCAPEVFMFSLAEPSRDVLKIDFKQGEVTCSIFIGRSTAETLSRDLLKVSGLMKYTELKGKEKGELS